MGNYIMRIRPNLIDLSRLNKSTRTPIHMGYQYITLKFYVVKSGKLANFPSKKQISQCMTKGTNSCEAAVSSLSEILLL